MRVPSEPSPYCFCIVTYEDSNLANQINPEVRGYLTGSQKEATPYFTDILIDVTKNEAIIRLISSLFIELITFKP